jgi:hypothetical protein
MNNSIIFTIFLFLVNIFTQITCQETVTPDFNLKYTQHIFYHHQVLEKIKDSETTYFVYYYRPDSNNSIKGLQFLIDILPKMTNLAQVLMINCFTSDYMDKSVCQRGPEVKDGFPRMVLLSPPKLKFNPYTGKENSYSEKKYPDREVSPKLLYNFITEGITDYSVNLDNDKNAEHVLAGWLVAGGGAF